MLLNCTDCCCCCMLLLLLLLLLHCSVVCCIAYILLLFVVVCCCIVECYLLLLHCIAVCCWLHCLHCSVVCINCLQCIASLFAFLSRNSFRRIDGSSEQQSSRIEPVIGGGELGRRAGPVPVRQCIGDGQRGDQEAIDCIQEEGRPELGGDREPPVDRAREWAQRGWAIAVEEFETDDAGRVC